MGEKIATVVENGHVSIEVGLGLHVIM